MTDEPLQAALLSQTAFAVSPIHPNDYRTYHSYFAQDARPIVYGNTWTYITQACRAFGLGIKWQQPDRLVSVGAHRGHYVVVRPLGALDATFIAFVQQLRALSGKPVFLKKLFPDQTEFLAQHSGFEPVMTIQDGEPVAGRYVWDESAFADDDTYPELIYDREVIANHGLSKAEWGKLFNARRPGLTLELQDTYQERMRKFNRDHRRFVQNLRDLQIIRYNSTHASDVRAFLAAYFSGRAEQIAAYDNIFMLPREAKREDYYNLLSYVGKTLVGVHIGERVGADAASVCVGVADRSIRGLGAFVYLYLFDFLTPFNIQRINVGGAESATLQKFKQTPCPIEERQMAMWVYGVDDV
jgi:hypothetical protein